MTKSQNKRWPHHRPFADACGDLTPAPSEFRWYFQPNPKWMKEDLPNGCGIYAWMAQPPGSRFLLNHEVPGTDMLCLYVGQSTNLRARSISHVNATPRGSVGRELKMLQRIGYLVWLGFHQTTCDCALDVLEGAWMEQLRPYMNKLVAPGRPDVHDEYCLASRA